MEVNEIINRVTPNAVESNLVYPMDQGYKAICEVDRRWFRQKLAIEFGRELLHNKYACVMDGKVYYMCDGSVYLVEREPSGGDFAAPVADLRA